MTDLDAAGKLDETLVVVAAEFGRSPKITKSNADLDKLTEYLASRKGDDKKSGM